MLSSHLFCTEISIYSPILFVELMSVQGVLFHLFFTGDMSSVLHLPIQFQLVSDPSSIEPIRTIFRVAVNASVLPCQRKLPEQLYLSVNHCLVLEDLHRSLQSISEFSWGISKVIDQSKETAGMFQSQVSHVLTFFSKNIPTKTLTAHPDICVLLFCTIYTTNHKQSQQTNDDEDNLTMGILFPQAWVWTNRRVNR